MENTRLVEPDSIKKQAEQIAKVMADIQEAITGKGYEILCIESRLKSKIDIKYDALRITFNVAFPDESQFT